MSTLRRALLVLATISSAALLLAAPARAGQEPEITVESVDISGFPEVRLTVAPPSALAGKEIKGDSFTLEENGVEREIGVTRLGGGAIDVVVVIDTSGSMRGEPIIAAKSSALSFVNRLPASTNVALIGFGNGPVVASPFTTDKGAVANAIDGLQADGETSLYDAVIAASTLLASGTADQHAIVLLSDGGDTVSTAPIEQAVSRLSETGAGFTAIELTTGETDRASLDRLAAAADGGRVLSVNDPGTLDATYGAIAERLSNLYELRFFSSGGTRADLHISISQDGVNADTLVPVEFPDRAAPTTEATVPEVAAPRPYTETGGVLTQNWLLIAGAALVAVALAVGIAVAIGDREPQRRLAQEYSDAGVDEAGVEWLSGLANKAADISEQIIESQGQTSKIDDALDSAGVSLRAGELVSLVAICCLAGAMFGFLLFGPLGFIIGGVLPALLTPSILSVLRSRRRQKFGDQLGDTLLLLAGSLRAGYGLVQAVDSVARESEAPMSVEFSRVVVETRLGRDLNDALDAVATRVGSEDFRWVVEAMEIHREVGGDLAEVLDHVGETIRARARVVRQVRALSAEGKLSAIVLFSLPFAVGVLVATSNPDYMDRLFNSTGGHIMLLGAGVLLVLGGLWLRKIVKPEF